MIRLIEHQPAWELHAFLHFSGLSYKCEYSPTPRALGVVLPVLIIDNSLYSGEAAYDIIRKHSNDKHHNHLEELVASYVEKKLCTLLEQFERVTGSHKRAIYQSAPWGLNLGLASLVELSYIIDLKAVGPYPGESDEQLLMRFHTIYAELDNKLIHCENSSICSHWTKTIQIDQYGVADAILFAHIARASCNETLAPIVKSYENIMKYFYDICDQFFGRSVASFSDFSWQVSLYHLLQNPYLAIDQAEWLKNSLTESLQNFNAQQIFEINHSHDEITTFHPAVFECMQSEEEKILNAEHTHNNTHFVMTNFGLVFTALVSASLVAFLCQPRRS